MGVAAGAILGGALLGFGAAAMSGGKQDMPNYNSTFNTATPNAPTTVPTMPQAPTVPKEEGDKPSDDMLAAQEAERKKRAAEAEKNKTNVTGGMGLTTPATVQRKTLLG